MGVSRRAHNKRARVEAKIQGTPEKSYHVRNVWWDFGKLLAPVTDLEEESHADA
jgi:hypothetical protein